MAIIKRFKRSYQGNKTGFWPNYRFLTKFSIFDQILDFCPNYQFLSKLSIFGQIINFWQNFEFVTKFTIFHQILHFWPNYRFLTIFDKNSIKVWYCEIAQKVIGLKNASWGYEKLLTRISPANQLMFQLHRLTVVSRSLPLLARFTGTSFEWKIGEKKIIKTENKFFIFSILWSHICRICGKIIGPIRPPKNLEMKKIPKREWNWKMFEKVKMIII